MPPRKAMHRKSTKRFGFCLNQCWRPLPILFLITRWIASATHRRSCTGFVLRETIFYWCLPRFQSPLQKLWIWYDCNCRRYKWRNWVKMGTWGCVQNRRQLQQDATGILLCCFLRLNRPSPNWVWSGVGLRKRARRLWKSLWRRRIWEPPCQRPEETEAYRRCWKKRSWIRVSSPRL